MVASKNARTGGRTVDRRSLMLPLGQADIFFPTNFDMLRRAYLSEAQAANRTRGGDVKRGNGEEARLEAEAEVWTTADFMRSFAPEQAEATRTRGGYNPMLEEYENMRIFTAKTL